MKMRRHTKRQAASSRKLGFRKALDAALMREYGMDAATVGEWIASWKRSNKAMGRLSRRLDRLAEKLKRMSGMEEVAP